LKEFGKAGSIDRINLPRRAAAAYPTHFQAAIILAFPKK
jgi:hypothetical protein